MPRPRTPLGQTDIPGRQSAADEHVCISGIHIAGYDIPVGIAVVPLAESALTLKRPRAVHNPQYLIHIRTRGTPYNHLIHTLTANIRKISFQSMPINVHGLCCLLKAGSWTKEIMLVTQQSLQTVYQRKSSIRKKTGMPEKADIAAHIDRIRESRH